MRRDIPERRSADSHGFRRNRMLAFSLCSAAFVASVGITATTTVKDFRVPEYYDPPHETQMKSLLEGGEAEPMPGGMILLRALKLRTFSETGQPQIVVEAPQCVFNSTEREVSSAGSLQVRTANGQFQLEGEGFLWRQTNSNLIISNRVHTIIRKTPDKPLKP
jgi:hypothetical protein